MSNITKNYSNLKLINFLKLHHFFIFLMSKNNKIEPKNIKKEQRIPKLRLHNNTKNIFLSSLAFHFQALIKNTAILYKIDISISRNFDFGSNLLLAIRLNNKIYSKYCLTNFVNSYSYYQSKKLLYKLFVLRLKNFSSKYIRNGTKII